MKFRICKGGNYYYAECGGDANWEMVGKYYKTLEDAKQFIVDFKAGKVNAGADQIVWGE